MNNLILTPPFKVILAVAEGPEKGKIFEFTEQDNFLLGRDAEGSHAHFRLSPKDTYVSRNHFLLEINPPDCFLSDAGSLNGTFVVRKGQGGAVFLLEGREKDKKHFADKAERLKKQYQCSTSKIVNEHTQIFNDDLILVGNTIFKVTVIQKLPDSPLIHQVPLHFCQNCGKEIARDPRGLPHRHMISVDLICSECKSRPAKAQGLKHIVACYGCGKDVSAKGNSDGRAEELKEIALYYCQQCASSEQKRVPVKKIGNYYIIKELGEGGFGIVFLAWHEKTGRIFALKLTREKIKKDDELIRRFKREIAVMKNLSHPNLVRLCDEGISDTDNYYLVSEYLPEGSLADLINDQFAGKMPYRQAASIFVQALEGLSFFHKKGFIHRDIKPENMLLRKDNNGRYVAKIGDFGLSKSYILHGGTITKAGEFAGTLFYCAPEQIFNFKDVRPHTDIYSIGMTLYHIITGEYPYDFPTRQRFVEMAKQGQRPRDPIDIILSADKPTPIEKKRSDIPGKLAKAINKAIEKDASKRFKSAEEFKNALSGAL